MAGGVTGLSGLMIPLFPLKISVLPKEILPLHIFENRYIEMISNSIDSGQAFGMIYRDKGQFSNIGCSVKVHQTINTYPDGKCDILIKGIERFKVINYIKKKVLGLLKLKVLMKNLILWILKVLTLFMTSI